jgi:hypothetical protein
VRFRIWITTPSPWISRNREVLVVNDVGVRVLSLLDGRRTLGAVRDILAQEFDAPSPQVEGDLETYAAELLAAGIVEERR